MLDIFSPFQSVICNPLYLRVFLCGTILILHHIIDCVIVIDWSCAIFNAFCIPDKGDGGS